MAVWARVNRSARRAKCSQSRSKTMNIEEGGAGGWPKQGNEIDLRPQIHTFVERENQNTLKRRILESVKHRF